MTLSCPRGESQFSRPLKSSKKTPIGQKKPLDAPPLASEETINRSAMWKAMFNGTNVFLSRYLVPPEAHDAAHDAVKLNGAYDALKLNGAQVFLCCDPSRNSPDDYHIISSPDHEKFELLKSKGCNLLGPQCVLSCAKERRVLPKQGYTCCLAMDGVKVLAFGFEREKKAIIGKLVAGMGGILQTKASLDVNFVIVKDVLAAKYK